jgi:hypothetical protein
MKPNKFVMMSFPFTNVYKSHVDCSNFETLIQWSCKGLQIECFDIFFKKLDEK